MLKSDCWLPALLPVLCLFVSGSAGAAAPRYAVTPLDNTGTSWAYAINSAGTVAAADSRADSAGRTAFTWSAGVKTMLPSQMARPAAISNAGHVAGTSGLYMEGSGMVMIRVGKVYSDGTMSGVPDAFSPRSDPGGWYTFTSPTGINSAGTMVVNQETNSGGGAYIASHGATTILPINYAAAINEAGQVAGRGQAGADPEHAMLYSAGQAVDLGALPTDLYAISAASDLNDAGTVVGSSAYGFGEQAHYHSFIYHEGVMQPLGSLTVRNSAVGINNRGDVVGNFLTDGTSEGKHSYLYQDGVQYDLDALLVGGGDWRIAEVRDINDSGQIVGRACRDGVGCFAALLSPVPEPATWGMLLGGLGLLAWCGRPPSIRRAARARFTHSHQLK